MVGWSDGISKPQFMTRKIGRTSSEQARNLHGCAMPWLSSFGHLSLRTTVHFSSTPVRISQEASTTFSLIFESLVFSCLQAVVIQHQKLKRCISHLLVRGIRMETRLTFLLMILAQSVLPKVSGIWVQLSIIRSHRMPTSTIGSPKPREPLAL